MFRGKARLSIDEKGRVAIPSVYRKRLMEMEGCGGRLVVTPHWDGCLLIYPLPEWEIVEERLRELPNTKTAVRNLQRFLLGNAMDRDLDGQGRLLIPADMREAAKLDGQAVLVAQSNKFELW
jgi:MraZ protein